MIDPLYIMVAAIILVILALVGGLMADYWNSKLGSWGPVYEGEVVQKAYKEAHTTYTYVSNGKTTTMVPRRHPEEYHLIVQIEDARNITITVDNEEIWNQKFKDVHIAVRPRAGRWWGNELYWQFIDQPDN